MTTLTDARFAALRGQGLVGATSDMIVQWLQLNGATSPTVSGAWKEVLDLIQPPDPNHRADQWHSWLFLNGYGAPSKHRSDMEKDFWEAGGILGPKHPSNIEFNTDFSTGFA